MKDKPKLRQRAGQALMSEYGLWLGLLVIAAMALMPRVVQTFQRAMENARKNYVTAANLSAGNEFFSVDSTQQSESSQSLTMDTSEVGNVDVASDGKSLTTFDFANQP